MHFSVACSAHGETRTHMHASTYIICIYVHLRMYVCILRAVTLIGFCFPNAHVYEGFTGREEENG